MSRMFPPRMDSRFRFRQKHKCDVWNSSHGKNAEWTFAANTTSKNSNRNGSLLYSATGRTMEEEKEGNAMVSSLSSSSSDMQEKKKKNHREDSQQLCPLFMQGLPSDFDTNPQLAAIASLINDDDDDDHDNNNVDDEDDDGNSNNDSTMESNNNAISTDVDNDKGDKMDGDESASENKDSILSSTVQNQHRRQEKRRQKQSRRERRQQNLGAAPYPTKKSLSSSTNPVGQGKSKTKKTTMGEAQLFLKMWKL